MGKYQIIYADPPWAYDDPSLNRGGALRHYATMPIEDIMMLPINKLADNNCVLFMWATFPKLKEALDTITAWDFTFKTCAFVWVKINRRTNPEQSAFLPYENFDSFTGMGRWTRSNAEICLLGVKGKPQRISASVHQIIYAPISDHSIKPLETRHRILELLGDLPRVELFARQKAEGWDSWGNEIKSDFELPKPTNKSRSGK